jgi:hypothetical protein
MCIFFYIYSSPVISIWCYRMPTSCRSSSKLLENFLFWQTYWPIFLHIELMLALCQRSYASRYDSCIYVLLWFWNIFLSFYIHLMLENALLLAGRLPNFLRSFSSNGLIDLFSCTLSWCQLYAQILTFQVWLLHVCSIMVLKDLTGLHLLCVLDDMFKYNGPLGAVFIVCYMTCSSTVDRSALFSTKLNILTWEVVFFNKARYIDIKDQGTSVHGSQQ